MRELADSLLTHLRGLVVPRKAWAPPTQDSALYEPFMWLGQHLAIAIFICVIAVCGLTAWQGVPRLKQMGASTGWTLVAVAGMASVPGVVMMLNRAVSDAFTAAFASNEGTLFGAITADMKQATDANNPLSLLLLFAAIVVALAIAALVFVTRQLGILAFVCMAPLVLASLARGGDWSAVQAWAQRLLGLMFAPFALLLVAPFVSLAQNSLILHGVLLVAADAVMLRMIFHGVPYIGPRVARAARTMVESRTDSVAARAVVRAGVPDIYEEEATPRTPRTVATPRRAAAQDGAKLLGAFGVTPRTRPGRLTTASAVAKAGREEADRASRTAQISQARRQARRAAGVTVVPRTTTPAPAPAPGPAPSAPPQVRPTNPNP
ncbi:hypothetical protein [Streptomyces sp. NPDC021608]|uniref:hypothetical protein n=1 Tax=Streptomyces sp. NPDC021608 TaxID=3154903 RepID=UPI0033E230F0